MFNLNVPSGQQEMDYITNPKKWSTFLSSNGYQKITCIGHGSFGDVYAVSSLDSGVDLAVKRMVSRNNITEDNTWLAESQALLKLDHENIVQLKEILITPKMACLVLELAPYGNLELLTERLDKRFDVSFVITAFQQTVSAVKCCHDNDIAHCDINPSNILVFSHHLVKLADFGLSFRCRDVSSGKEILCTDYLGHDSYIAPEVIKRQPFSAKPADVWSLGCLLFFMIAGKHPAKNTNSNELRACINEWMLAISTSDDSSKVSLSNLCHTDPELRPLISE
ncbi:sperm motility kinase W, partial [Biomphalaria glabrata]